MNTDSGWAGFLNIITKFILNNLLTVWIIGAILLFAPSGLANRLAISTFREQYKNWIGPITVITFAIWIVDVLSEWQRRRRYFKETKQILQTLSLEEFRVLASCVKNNYRTIPLDLFNPVTAALCQKGLLSPYSTTGAQIGRQDSFPHTIPPIVWKVLMADRAIIIERLAEIESAQAKSAVDNIRYF